MRKNTASATIMIGPPTNSARVNCQPISSARITPSSITRLVDAISKAIAAVKLAPLRKSDRASATAAYEQDDDAMPSPVAIASVRGRSSPSSRTTVARRTSACTTADSANPRISAHRISQVIDPASASARPTASIFWLLPGLDIPLWGMSSPTVHRGWGYRTRSVIAAVRSRPPVWNWTNSRQSPDLGSIATKVSFGPP